MATRSIKRRSSTKNNQNEIKDFFGRYIFSPKSLPIVLALSVMGILFVLIRMKGIEQDYRYNEVTKQLKIIKIENKELKADRAQVLSMKNLKAFAQKFELKEPDEKHIIVIP